MSLLDRLLSGVTFRTATPEFDPGEEFTAYVTGVNESGVVVRIGDSVLHIRDGAHSLVDRQVRLTVTSFDTDTCEGEAELLSVVGEE